MHAELKYIYSLNAYGGGGTRQIILALINAILDGTDARLV